MAATTSAQNVIENEASQRQIWKCPLVCLAVGTKIHLDPHLARRVQDCCLRHVPDGQPAIGFLRTVRLHEQGLIEGVWRELLENPSYIRLDRVDIARGYWDVQAWQQPGTHRYPYRVWIDWSRNWLGSCASLSRALLRTLRHIG